MNLRIHSFVWFCYYKYVRFLSKISLIHWRERSFSQVFYGCSDRKALERCWWSVLDWSTLVYNTIQCVKCSRQSPEPVHTTAIESQIRREWLWSEAWLVLVELRWAPIDWKGFVDIISELKEQLNSIVAITFNALGTPQRDAPPVQLSPKYPDPPPSAPTTTATRWSYRRFSRAT